MWMKLLSMGLTLAACWVLACRIDKMLKGTTQPGIFVQHFLMAIGLFGSFLLVFTEWADLAPASMAAGVLAFFAFSASRWRRGAPVDTRSGDLDDLPQNSPPKGRV